MSTPPADPPPLAPEPVPHPPEGRPSTHWTSFREAAFECTECGTRYVLSYKYRFVEGLEAARVRCPSPGCRHGREYFLPVNAFDIRVTAASGDPPPLA
jgi:hypothetical protein